MTDTGARITKVQLTARKNFNPSKLTLNVLIYVPLPLRCGLILFYVGSRREEDNIDSMRMTRSEGGTAGSGYSP